MIGLTRISSNQTKYNMYVIINTGVLGSSREMYDDNNNYEK